MQNKNHPMSSTQLIAAEQDFMSKVYGWMASALLITGLTAFYIANYQIGLIEKIFENPLFFYGIIIGQLGLVLFLSARIDKISLSTATLLFYVYALSVGFTFSIVFLIYTSASIASTFFITAGTFGAMSLYGYYTKADLTSIGNILIMLLFGVIIASVVNLFLKSPAFYWITTFIGLFVFVGLTAYDTQKIKKMSLVIGSNNNESVAKLAIVGALRLYLDFINLFLYLLRLFGRER